MYSRDQEIRTAYLLKDTALIQKSDKNSIDDLSHRKYGGSNGDNHDE